MEFKTNSKIYFDTFYQEHIEYIEFETNINKSQLIHILKYNDYNLYKLQLEYKCILDTDFETYKEDNKSIIIFPFNDDNVYDCIKLVFNPNEFKTGDMLIIGDILVPMTSEKCFSWSLRTEENIPVGIKKENYKKYFDFLNQIYISIDNEHIKNITNISSQNEQAAAIAAHDTMFSD